MRCSNASPSLALGKPNCRNSFFGGNIILPPKSNDHIFQKIHQPYTAYSCGRGPSVSDDGGGGWAHSGACNVVKTNGVELSLWKALNLEGRGVDGLERTN